jgi:hypothetical protein
LASSVLIDRRDGFLRLPASLLGQRYYFGVEFLVILAGAAAFPGETAANVPPADAFSPPRRPRMYG